MIVFVAEAETSWVLFCTIAFIFMYMFEDKSVYTNELQMTDRNDVGYILKKRAHSMMK